MLRDLTSFHLPPMKKYTHLSSDERDQLFVLLQSGITNCAEISRTLKRDPSTVRREIRRNKVMIGTKHNNNPHTKNNPKNFHYIPDRAQKKYLSRRKESKQKCPLNTIALFVYVIRKLKEGLSPELIAGRAKLKGIGDISHECIYQFIYSKTGKEMQFYEYLIRAHKRRRRQKGRKH